MAEHNNMERLRLLALSTSYPLRSGSSSGIFVHRLYAALQPNWAIEVVCPDDTSVSAESFDGIAIAPARYAPKPWQVLGGPGGIVPQMRKSPSSVVLLPLLLASIFLTALVRIRNTDLIHANWTVSGLLAVILGGISGKPVVVTLRGSDVSNASPGTIYSWLLKTVVRHADALVCVSEPMRSLLLQRFPAWSGKILCIQNGVSEEFFKVVREDRRSNGPFRLLAVGSLLPVKGFDLLLDALSVLKNQFAFHLTIVGEGPERSALQTRIDASRMTSQVTLAGAVSPSVMPGYFANADVFVLSSRCEGRPNAAVEAVATGLPVISAGLPGVRDLVDDGENGWLFNTGDLEALQKVFQRAMADSAKWPEMGRLGQGRLQASGTWQAAAEQYHRLFCSAMKRRKK